MGIRDGVGELSPHARLASIAARAQGQIGAENFPVALKILPRTPRERLQRLYRYARFVDDVGDTAEGDRLELLDAVAGEIEALWSGGSSGLTPVAELAPLRADCGAPAAPFLALVEANRVDQRVSCYESFADLLGYCQLSAAPVGQVVLHIAGAATEANIADSDRICAALQVLEHCQDVGEDARAGRTYLPAEELHLAGVSQRELLGANTGPELRRVLARQVERSRELLAEGHGLVRRLSGWSRLAVAGFVGGGYATADALAGADYAVLERLIKPGKRDTARHALRLMVTR